MNVVFIWTFHTSSMLLIQLIFELTFHECSFYIDFSYFIQINQHIYDMSWGECESWFVGIWPTWILMKLHSRPASPLFFAFTEYFHSMCFSSSFLLIFTSFLVTFCNQYLEGVFYWPLCYLFVCVLQNNTEISTYVNSIRIFKEDFFSWQFWEVITKFS